MLKKERKLLLLRRHDIQDATDRRVARYMDRMIIMMCVRVKDGDRLEQRNDKGVELSPPLT